MKQLDKSHYKVYTIYIRLYSDLKYYVKDVSQMKNVLKKIAATALAFALLGTGSAITTSSKSKNTFTATAASCKHNCRHYSQYFPVGDYIIEYAYCCNCNSRIYPCIRVIPRW